MNPLAAFMLAKQALKIARAAQDSANSALNSIPVVESNAANNITGAYSPEGVVTGFVLGQIFNQISGATLDVTQVWRFEGTVGTKTGWNAV